MGLQGRDSGRGGLERKARRTGVGFYAAPTGAEATGPPCDEVAPSSLPALGPPDGVEGEWLKQGSREARGPATAGGRQVRRPDGAPGDTGGACQ